jgi:flagellar motility protein MotE (MotC chaperone)
MKNKDIQELKQDIHELKELLKALEALKAFLENLNVPELRALFQDGVEHLRKILENQKNSD